MKALLLCFGSIIGAVFGSFVNVIIYRLPRKISFVKGRSMCLTCGNSLKAKDLVPILSWLFLKGRCRYCGEKISVQYPIVELLGAVAGCLSILCFDNVPAMMLSFAVLLILIAIGFIDAGHQIIPNSLVIVLAFCAVISIWIFPQIDWLSRLIGCLCIALPMFIMALGLNAFGMGDVKFTAIVGFLLGWQLMLIGFFVAVMIGGCFALIKIFRGTATKKIAFGPYLCIGTATALLFGEQIVRLYCQIILL